jgi:hypothetical protein
MLTLGDNLGAKTSKNEQPEYYCSFCDYKCSKKFNWDRHLLTSKHIDAAKCDISAAKCDTFGEKTSKNEQHHLTCEFCNKTYLHRQSLWRHYKTCKDTVKETNEFKLEHNTNEPTDKQLMMMLIKETSGFKDLILEIVKNGIHNTTNNNTNTNTTTHTNSHNKAFNLQFFLNETCKNAMNITDFVDSIKLQLSDLMDVGEKGFVEGISNIIIKNLNALDENVRPVHCTDKKRETFYVKDDNQWSKEDQERTKLRYLIKRVANKNINLMRDYKQKYPDYNDATSRHSDEYSKIVIEAMGGNGSTTKEKEERIIKNISKATGIHQS